MAAYRRSVVAIAITPVQVTRNKTKKRIIAGPAQSLA